MYNLADAGKLFGIWKECHAVIKIFEKWVTEHIFRMRSFVSEKDTVAHRKLSGKMSKVNADHAA